MSYNEAENGNTLRLITEYGDYVLRICSYYANNKSDAEDIFQEVFLKLHKSFTGFRGGSAEKTWITRVAINTCKDYLRKKSNNIRFISESDELAYICEKMDSLEEDCSILDCINLLPDIYKDVLLLYYYDDYSTAQIAKLLKLKDSTVRSRLKRARDLLSKIFAKRGIEYV